MYHAQVAKMLLIRKASLAAIQAAWCRRLRYNRSNTRTRNNSGLMTSTRVDSVKTFEELHSPKLLPSVKKSIPSVNPSRNYVMPDAYPVTDKSSDIGLLQNLRLVVGNNYGYNYGTSCHNKETKKFSDCSLAGDPRHLSCCQNIRAEILEKWNTRPQPDVQREWLKNLVFF